MEIVLLAQVALGAMLAQVARVVTLVMVERALEAVVAVVALVTVMDSRVVAWESSAKAQMARAELTRVALGMLAQEVMAKAALEEQMADLSMAAYMAVAVHLVAAMALCVSFIHLVARPALSLQQTQEIYKWNFLFALKTVSRLSIQFLVIIFAMHFLM
jgi:hypothetical protein